MYTYLMHSGKGHDDNPPGRGSGRYAFGSGKRPFQREKKKPNLTTEEMQDYIKRRNVERTYKKEVNSKLERTRNVLNEASTTVNRVSNKMREEDNRDNRSWERMDLSNMSDKELRDRINRENLEIQYSRMFNAKDPEVSKGRKIVEDLLDAGGDAIGIAASIATIILLFKR